MKAVITIEDDGDEVKINAYFGENGINDESYAHYLACFAVEKIAEKMKSEDA